MKTNVLQLKNLPPTQGRTTFFKYLSLLAMVLMLGVNGVKGQVSITTLPQTYTQDFTLGTSNVSWTDNSTLTGWYSSDASVDANNGSGNSNGVYNYGTTSATDRALGALSTATTHRFGIRIKNNSSSSISSFTIAFRGEQWRQNSSAQTLVFEYQVSSSALTSLTTGTWTAATAFDFVSPNTGTAGALDGNATGNFTNKSGTLTVTVAAGSEIFIRWVKSGSNSHGLAIDDLSITANSSTSSSSNIVLNTSFTHPTNIDYAAYQTASTLTTGNSIEVGQFDIQDGGGSSDADALSTTLTAISFTVANFGNIRTLALFDGSTNVGEITSVTATSSFSGLTLAAADNGSKTFSLRATFKSSVTDNQQISFTVSSATASGSGSSFAAANAGAAATTTTGDNNRIEVATTDIIFDQNVSNVAQNAVMSPSPTVRAIDANLNFDLDNTSNVVMTISAGSTTFGSATTTVAMVAGVATFNNLVFATAATSNNLTATQGAFTDNSSAFNVTAAAPEINVRQNVTNLASGSGSHAAGNQISGTSGSAITFTIENLGSANLTYSSITSSNTTDFTLDLTGTSTPIAASGTTTFTVAFNPTTVGAKSTTITINNNDADEGTYTFTVTGTGTVSSASDIITNSGYSYSSNIDYASFQTASTLTTGNSVGVNGLIIQDGAGVADADNLGTTLTAISFATGGSTAIRTAALFDGSTNVSEVAVNGATTISFSGLSLSATDDLTKNFELRVTYQSGVTDNQQTTFTVTSATASSTNSGFAAANAGAAASSTSGDINRIEVTADRLAFVAQPANTAISAGMTNVTVSANDGNGNRDLDFTSSVRITSTGTLTGTPVDVSASLGLATFTSLTHTASGTGLTLNAERTSSLDWDVTSNTFNITIQTPGLLLTEDDFNYTVSSNIITVGTGWGITSSGTTKVTTTASNNGLTMTNYPSTNTTGISFVAAGSSEDVAKSFTAQTSGSVYASTLVNLTSASNGYLTGFTTTNTSTTYEVRVHVRTVSGNLNFGISRASGTVTWDASNYALNTTYFLAVKLTMNASTNDDRIDLFVSTSISNSEPSTPNATITSATDVTTIAAVFVRQDATAGAGRIDGIRVASNWGALVGNPYYNSSTNIGAGTYNTINVLSGTVTATGNVTVNGTTTNDGVIAIGANTLTLGGTVSGSGTLTGGATSNLTITGASGTLNFDQTTPGTTNLLRNLTISGSGTTILGNALNITGGTTFGVVTVGSGATLTTGGNLTLKSDATGTASIGQSAGTISGNVTVERHIPALSTSGIRGRYRFLASPLTDATLADWQGETHITGSGTGFDATTSNAPSVYWYEETKGGLINTRWTAATSTTGYDLVNGRGYRVFIRGDRTPSRLTGTTSNPAPDQNAITLNLIGTLKQGTVNFDSPTDLVTYTGSGSDAGWCLIGNPYASPIDWQAATGWTRSNVGTGIAIFNPQTNSYSYSLTSGDASDNSTVTVNGGSRYISSGQGFFIRTTGSSPSLSCTESVKVTNTPAYIYKSAPKNQLRLKLTQDSANIDETVIALGDKYFDDYIESEDVNKLVNTTVNISSVVGVEKYAAINFTSTKFNEKTIPLSVWGNVNGNYKLELTQVEALEAGITVSLRDKFLNTITAINENKVFNIELNDNSKGDNRFELVFKNTGTSVENVSNTSSNLLVYPNPATDVLNINISNANFKNSEIVIYSISGTEVLRSNMANTNAQLNIETLSAGVYFVKVSNQNGFNKTVKFVK